MAKASKKSSSSSTRYDAARELKSIVNQNVQYGLDAMEAATDSVGDAIESAFGSARGVTEDTTDMIDSVIRQTKKAYKTSFGKMRKQARDALS